MILRWLLILSFGLAAPVFADKLPGNTTWLGNTFPGGDAGWVPQDVEDIFVTPDGTVFTTVMWEEHRGNLAAFKNGAWVQQSAHWKSGGIDREVGRTLCVTEQHVFFATDKGRFLGRRDRADIASRNGERKVEIGVEIRGLAASVDRVFAAGADGRVRVFDHELKALGEWAAPSPGEACVDALGNVWIIDTESRSVLCFDAQGKRMPREITSPDGVIPVDVAMTPDQKLLIADAGPLRQVRVYHHLDTTPELERTLGEPGGILAGPKPGVFGDQRFISPIGVGADAQGNIYVASGPYAKTQGGTTVIESYAPNGALNWRVLSTEWLDTVGVDHASDAQVIYGSKYRYALDLSREAGQQWTLKALTLNPDKFPDDARLQSAACGGVWHRVIQGRSYLFFPDMTGGNLFICRFDPASEGEIAVPCGQIGTKQTWMDTNGDGHRQEDEITTLASGDTQGWLVDESSSVWQATRRGGIIEHPLVEVSAKGVPVYADSARKVTPMPEPFTELRRLVYDRASDTMYLGGATAENQAGHWKPMGPVLVRYDHWSKQREIAWQAVLPHDAGSGKHESFEPFDFVVEGDYIFAVYAGRLPSQDLPPGTVMIYDKRDCRLIGHLQPPGTRSGAVPMDALQDMVHSINVHRRADGEYLIFIEDDGYTKNMMYRWRP